MPDIILKFGGHREGGAVTTEEAEKKKSLWEDKIAGDNVVVVKVDLSCRQWSVDALKVLEPLLQKVAPTILSLDIADTIAGLETSVGFAVMELIRDIFAGAKEVREINMDDNATGPRVLERIAPLLGAPKVKRVYFRNCGLSAETMTQLDEALLVDGKGMARLEALALNKNMIGVEGARYVGERLATCVNLADFEYCGCRPNLEGTKYLAQGLKNLVVNSGDNVVAMARLKLEDCNLVGSDEDFSILEDLGNALEKMPKLTHLNLRDGGDFGETGTGMVSQALLNSGCKLVDLDMSACGLGQDGAETLAELIEQKLGTLKELKLETNEFENDGVEKILGAFKIDNSLERLHLDENELDEGVIDLLLAANLPKLKFLSLKDNMDLEEASDEKKEELRKKFAGATVLISDDDDEEEVKEDPDKDVDDLTAMMAQLGK